MPAADFDLPDGVHDDDVVLLHNVLTAMEAGGKCRGYQVHTVAHGYVLRGTLAPESFEVDSDDLFFIAAVSPLRIERVTVARCAGRSELVVSVLDCKQRVVATGAATFTVTKKRRLALLPAAG